MFHTSRHYLLLLPFLAATPVLGDLPPDHAERMTRGLAMFKDIAPLLRENCVECHGGEKTKADFDLATREGLLLGGADGAVVVPFDSAASRMLKMLRHEEEPHMPDKKPKLPDTVIEKIAAWIDHGAPYEAPLVAGKAAPRDKSKVTDADRQWWAFQPLSHPPVPPHAPHPVDAFLLAKASPRGLKLNLPADPRALARRAYLTITGLPPSPEEMTAFSEAFRPGSSDLPLIDKLLNSPHYGERWARHWLDVARFAESSGFEHDYDRPHAWHYRDFVIRAFNSDMPWTQFVNWQLAGDEFAPGNAEALMATGFLGAGVFPTQITANEVERVRYDALDDMLATTGSAMLGLTIGCARCHDHKFDPFPTQDYYRMLSTFTTTVRSNVDLELEPARAAQARATHKAEQDRLTADLSAWEAKELRPQFDAWLNAGAAGVKAGSWMLAEGEIKSRGGATFKKLPDGSWLAEGKNAASDVYTFTVRNAGRVSALKLEALAHESMKGKGPGRAANGNFALSSIKVTAEPPSGNAPQQVQEWKARAGEFTHQQNTSGLSVASSLDNDTHTGWAVDGQIGRDHAAVFVFDSPVVASGETKLTVTLEFDVNTSHNIGRPRFSLASEGVPKLNEGTVPPEILALAPKLNSLSAVERDTLWKWWRHRQPGVQDREKKIAEHAGKAPKSGEPVMVCVEGYEPIVMHSQGPPFLQETHILRRGDAAQKQAVATQSFLQVLMRGADEKQWQWSPPAGAKSSGRRRSFAHWITDVEHGGGALMARVIVNRLWQHHFGRGIVTTPNDFGRTGALPSHPELLDWLAGELIRQGWKLKPIHRLLMTSEAWRQSPEADTARMAADPDNTLFLRAMPRRLEAEVVRDCILAVSSQLDRTLYGKGTLDENSKRRSIYFTVKRSQLVNSMVVFDAPEPLVSQGNRPTTTVAPQALFLMNSPQSRSWAQSLAAAAMLRSPGDPPATWVDSAQTMVLGRKATPEELKVVMPFLENQTALHRDAGKPNPDQEAFTDYCQTLFGLNEFLYVP
jgi:mono/diheme cytochrome c family protein